MRPSCDEASRGRSRLRARCRERPNCAAPVCVRCVLRHEAERTDDPERRQPGEGDRSRAGARYREGERASERAARRQRRSGKMREMEEGLGSVESRGECAPIRQFTSLRTRQWLEVRLASLSVPPVAPSLTPRPSQLAPQRPAYYPQPATTKLLVSLSLRNTTNRIRPT